MGIDTATQLPVKVPWTIPGDWITANLWERDLDSNNKKQKQQSFIFGELHAIEQESNDRVRPACQKYFGTCGGCRYQHMDYALQLAYKQQLIEKMFQPFVKDGNTKTRQVHGVADVLHYRNKMEFTCSTEEWLLRDDLMADQRRTSFAIGLFPAKSVGVQRAKLQRSRKKRGNQWSPQVLSIDHCVVQDEVCDSILRELRTLLYSSSLAAYNFKDHSGHLKQIVLRSGIQGHDQQKEVMLGLVTTSFKGEQQKELERIVAELLSNQTVSNPITSVVQKLDEEALRHRSETDTVERQRTLYGRNFIYDRILQHDFRIAFDAFFQPNTAQANVLYGHIESAIQEHWTDNTKQPVIWDLFCGVGSIGICMAKHARKVVGFEVVESAVENARENAKLNGYDSDKTEFYCMDLTKAWSDAELFERVGNDRPDIVIVDPPRMGLHKKLIAALEKLRPKHICYVSCNPKTQVIDLHHLCDNAKGRAGYDLKMIQPVDMVPHTPHIETVAWLTRN